ncbi:hypothetical protein TL16_g11527 [Triparma laevis f. inornata]|uniref:EXPERA domain-containing protein n=1 Tax=Triparma laevis f. inornata TaxID=1714386 RepID=A0A9W7BJJ3_9STRA|nr:hypothetical protein TL16_g11527 [Triparma laevis f. inornata]
MPLLRVNSSYPPSPHSPPWYGPGIYASQFFCPVQTSTHSVYSVYKIEKGTITLRSKKASNDSLISTIKSKRIGGVNDVLKPEIKGLSVIEAEVKGLEGLLNIHGSSSSSSKIIEIEEPLGELTINSVQTYPLPIKPIFSCLVGDYVVFADNKLLYSLNLLTLKIKRIEFILINGVTIRGLKEDNDGVCVGLGKLNDNKNFSAFREYIIEDCIISIAGNNEDTKDEGSTEAMDKAEELEKKLELMMEEARKMKEEVERGKEERRIEVEEKEGGVKRLGLVLMVLGVGVGASRVSTRKPPKKYPDPPSTPVYLYLYRFWPFLFMLSTILSVSLLPLQVERGILVEPSPADSVFAYLTSPFLIFCVSATVLGLYWAFEKMGCSKRGDTEQMAMVWHLTNATWWSCGCDSWSGLFQVMPRMRTLYRILDSKHGVNFNDQTFGPPWNPTRAALDSVYWAETTVHVPLSWLTFYLYATEHPSRYLVEAFLGGVQFVGCFGYYGPEFLSWLHGFETSWPENKVIWWLGIGCVPLVWCALPIALTVRAALKNHSSLTKKRKKN